MLLCTRCVTMFVVEVIDKSNKMVCLLHFFYTVEMGYRNCSYCNFAFFKNNAYLCNVLPK